jgi:hypothetical protein
MNEFKGWLVFVLMFALLVLFLSKVAHGGGDCEGMASADQRNYCRAITRQDASYCEFIKDKDLRYACRALTKK